MTGSALMDFFIGLVVLGGVVGMFFVAIQHVAPDATFVLIARWAVGLAALLVLLIEIKAVLFGGGGGGLRTGPGGLIAFAIGLIAVLVVIYLVKLIVAWFGLGEPFAGAVLYIIGAVALIALLVLAQRVLFGGDLGPFLGARRAASLPWPLTLPALLPS